MTIGADDKVETDGLWNCRNHVSPPGEATELCRDLRSLPEIFTKP